MGAAGGSDFRNGILHQGSGATWEKLRATIDERNPIPTPGIAGSRAVG